MSLANYLDGSAAADLPECLARGVLFHSPVTDYRGRADITHLFRAIASVLDDVTVTRVITDDLGTVRFLSGNVGGTELTGVLDERLDADGLITEATLLLRPFGALKLAIARISEHLAGHPLPGRQGERS